MKIFLTFATFILLIFLATTGCGSKNSTKATDALPYSPYVEAFTSGSIPRETPVYLIFKEDVLAEKMTSEQLRKMIKLRPEVEGEFSYENGRTISFRPKKEFDRNTTYTVTADLHQFFGVDGRDKDFVFKFSTLPMALRAKLESIDINEKDEASYDVTVAIYTPDVETSQTIEPLIKVSEKMESSWQHNVDGKKHILTLFGVPAGKDGVRVLNLSVNANKLGVARDNILSVYIPGKNQFDVYDATYVSEPEKYIEITFSQLLDEDQQMHGLAFIRDNKSERVTVEGNKIRLYPDAGRTGELSIGIAGTVRSKNGLVLGEDITKVVEISSEIPDMRFIGEGVIIPQSTQIVVPFQAVYLRGVVVKVIKIMEQNVGQFLQNNQLDGQNELTRVGRLVARKTIFLDEVGQDLSKWGTYGVDLKQLMQPEQGAIYRVEISFTQELSAYPCDGLSTITKEQILAQDEIKFREEMNKYDAKGGNDYYYYYDDYDYYDYDYRDNNNPCEEGFYTGRNSIKRNVLATNLGVIAKAGEGNEMLVMVHNLISTAPENGVSVTVHNYQHQVIGSGNTDIKGHLTLSLPADSRAYYVVATQGKQRSYLRVDNSSSLSLSTFDVSGDVVQKGLKGYIYGDRGVWRPGDVMYLSFMLGDKAKSLPANHPVVMELYTPQGQLYLKKTQIKSALGIYAFEMPTEEDSPTGAWEVKVVVGGVSFSKRVRVEAIKPNRLKIDLKFDRDILLESEPLKGKLHVEWMQGAVARNLKYEVEGSFVPITTSFDKFKGYLFDDQTKRFSSETMNMFSGTTDEQGDAKIDESMDVGHSAQGMLMANLNMRVYEESGDFSIDAMRIPFSPYNQYVGVKSPQSDMNSLATGKNHTFDLASVNYKGEPLAGTKLLVEVYKVNWYWWWSSSNNQLANYISNSHNRPEKTLNIVSKSAGKASFDLSFTNEEWGTYYIVVTDQSSGHSTGVMSYFDWPSYGGRRDMEGSTSANLLSFKLDKKNYAPAEKMVLTIPSSSGSRAVVTIENGSRVLSTSEHDCAGEQTKISLDITDDMQPNAYVYVTLLQPHGITINDLPIRLYGVEPITVTSPESHLYPLLTSSDEIKPDSDYQIVVSEKSGREMAYTIAIVDEGLLDLTRFKTPDPWAVFNAREALGVRSWDMYNYVVGAYGGRIEQLFSIGGDDELAGSGPKAIVNRFKPVVQFDGPFILKKGAKQKHTYHMPNYNGRVRMMVVAGDGSAYGNVDKSVMVRKPVMLLGTLPRVIGTGEEMVVPANVFATEKGVGTVKVSIACSDNMQIMGGAVQELNFSDVTDKQAYFRIKVGSKPGAGRVVLTAVSKNDKSTYETDIEIRSVRHKQVKVLSMTLQAGKSWDQTVSMPGMDGTNKLTLEVSDVHPVNLSERLSFLLGYPHGCLEQITSKGFPQIYLKDFATLTTEQGKLADQAVKEVLKRHRSYQLAEGSFGYWPGVTSSHSWTTVYATHFQLEAEAKGYLVLESMKRNAINNLRLVARDWKLASANYNYSEQMTQAYRLYVLALAKKPELGAMNRMKEIKNLTSTSKWMLAAAYAKTGRVDVARSLITTTVDLTTAAYGEYDYTFGSDLRDKAMRLIALVLVDDSRQAAELAGEISKTLSSDEWLSTQATAFSLLALSEYMAKYKVSESMEFNYSYAGSGVRKIDTKSNIWSETLVDKGGVSGALSVKNAGKSTLFVRAITEGIPDQGDEKAYANGLTIEIAYLDTNGKVLDVSNLKQGVNFTAVVIVRNPTAKALNNIVLTQVFPAGWEILNTRFTDENAGNSYPAGLDYQDIRDDRVYSYIDRFGSGREVTVNIKLASAYAGMFYCPPVFVEAMYNNLVRANTQGRQVVVEK